MSTTDTFEPGPDPKDPETDQPEAVEIAPGLETYVPPILPGTPGAAAFATASPASQGSMELPDTTPISYPK